MTTEEFKKQLLDRAEYAASVVGAGIVVELARVVGVQAPYRISKTGRYVATVAATPGAPPRRLSGVGQASLQKFVERGADTVTLWVGTNLIYMAKHERAKNHVWLYKTIHSMEPSLQQKFEGLL